MPLDLDDEDDPAAPPPADRPHPKSRLMGGLFLLLGAMMTVALVGEGHTLDGRLLALVVFLASGGTWVGLGLVLFPWTRGMVAGFAAENNAALGFRRLPVLWKAWLAAALVLTVGTFVMAVRLKDDRAAVIAPGR